MFPLPFCLCGMAYTLCCVFLVPAHSCCWPMEGVVNHVDMVDIAPAASFHLIVNSLTRGGCNTHGALRLHYLSPEDLNPTLAKANNSDPGLRHGDGSVC